MTGIEEKVSIAKQTDAAYPFDEPFHPATAYPEYPFGREYTGPQNDIYEMVRECLWKLGLDRDRFGTADWNPLGVFIKPGHRVIIKPNLVQDRHYRGGDVGCLVTHGSVVRAVMDYIYKALDGRGCVVVGDAPVLSTKFDGAIRAARLGGVLDFYRAHAIPAPSVFDFRTVAGVLDKRFHVSRWVALSGDPLGNVSYDLGADSMLAPVAHLAHLIRLPHYRAGDTDPYHSGNHHIYVVPHCVIDADVIVNVPKMKTHCKAGITAALKNFVGIVALRHCYANYRQGSPHDGGDEYPQAYGIKRIGDYLEGLIDGNRIPGVRQLLSLAYRASERARKWMGVDGIYEGRWHGNDTVWRAILDLVRIARYGRADGTMADAPQRTLFTVLDGIVGGEGEGPLEARAKKAGLILAGFNPVATDVAVATLMRYDFRKIPTINNSACIERWPLLTAAFDDLRFLYEDRELTENELALKSIVEEFEPACGWVGHVERQQAARVPLHLSSV